MEAERIRAEIQVDVRSSGVVVFDFQSDRAVRRSNFYEAASEVSARSPSNVRIVEVIRRRSVAAPAYEYDFAERSARKIVLTGTAVELVMVGSDGHCPRYAS